MLKYPRELKIYVHTKTWTGMFRLQTTSHNCQKKKKKKKKQTICPSSDVQINKLEHFGICVQCLESGMCTMEYWATKRDEYWIRLQQGRTLKISNKRPRNYVQNRRIQTCKKWSSCRGCGRGKRKCVCPLIWGFFFWWWKYSGIR